MLEKMISLAPIMLAVLAAVNVILSGIAQILHAFGKSNAESIVGKVSSFIAKAVDLIQGNVAHK